MSRLGRRKCTRSALLKVLPRDPKKQVHFIPYDPLAFFQCFFRRKIGCRRPHRLPRLTNRKTTPIAHHWQARVTRKCGTGRVPRKHSLLRRSTPHSDRSSWAHRYTATRCIVDVRAEDHFCFTTEPSHRPHGTPPRMGPATTAPGGGNGTRHFSKRTHGDVDGKTNKCRGFRSLQRCPLSYC